MTEATLRGQAVSLDAGQRKQVSFNDGALDPGGHRDTAPGAILTGEFGFKLSAPDDGDAGESTPESEEAAPETARNDGGGDGAE